MTEHECIHVKNEEWPAITIVTHKAIPGAPTRADELETETKLCAVCSGWLISTLGKLEKDGLP